MATSSASAHSTFYAWYVAGLLCLGNTISFIDRTVLALLVEPIRTDLHLSDTQIGLLQGVTFILFYTVAGIPLGRWADIGNRPLIIGLGVTLWSLMTAASGLARTFWHLFWARIGVGVGEASLSPAALSLLADIFPRQLYGRAISIFMGGIWIGSGLALLLGGAVLAAVQAHGPVTLPLAGELKGWHVAFFAAAAPGLMFALLMLTVREPRRISNVRRPLIKVPKSEVVGFLFEYRALYVRHFMAFALITMFAYGALGWVPTLMVRVFGIDVSAVGLRWGALLLLFAPAGGYVAGWIADRGIRRGKSAAPMVVAAAGVVALLAVSISFFLAPSLVFATIIGTAFCFLLSFPFGIATSSLQLVTPQHLRGQVSAVYFLVVNIVGYSFGPLLVGAFTEHVFGRLEAVNLSLVLLAALTLPPAFWLLSSARQPFSIRLELQATSPIERTPDARRVLGTDVTY